MDLLASELRESLESQLGLSIDRALAGCREDEIQARVIGKDSSSSRSPLIETIRQFVRAGGKRIRPQLCLWTYLQATSGPDRVPPAVMQVACAWELFHAFLLCHDDIIDKADHRRGQPTLHHRLASLDGGSLIFGTQLGIVAGDLLFVGAMRLLHELDLEQSTPLVSPRSYQELLRLFSRVGCETGFGQAIDILQSHVPLPQVSEATVLRGYHWKTASYTFEGPMLTGAILAGLCTEVREVLSTFALSIGQAYQLHNDLLDLQSTAHEGCDLVQGKRTPTLLRARSELAASCRAAFDDRVESISRGNYDAVARAEELRLELIRGGAVERTRQIITSLLLRAASAANHPALTERLRQGLSGLLSDLSVNYFAAAAQGDCGSSDVGI